MSDELRALIFDTGGTVFDWFSAVRDTLHDVGRREGVEAGWAEVAADWRRNSLAMLGQMTMPADGKLDADMDEILHLSLGTVLDDHGLGRLRPHSHELVRGWRGMQPWADSANGISRLRERYVVASFTILNASLVIECSRRGGVNWDAVFSCEMSGIYKIAPRSYEYPAKWLDIAPQDIALVTAHNNDLEAAHRAGYRTAFIDRPAEWGALTSPDAQPSPAADWVASDIEDLARQLT
ncbi:hypothetical protein ACWDTP_21230 [Mycobacterium sp. NPDC003449]